MTENRIGAPDYDNPRILDTVSSNAHEGVVRWSLVKSAWVSTLMLFGVGGAFYTASLEALSVFLITSAVTLCCGHSLGMHRRFIHRSFECPLWLEYLFVYLGVLVGLAGPIGMMYTHDLRDWAQRQSKSHPYFGHKALWLKDAFWQMHCDLILKNPPVFQPGSEVTESRFYRFLERTWMLQQLPVMLLLFLLGGLEWLVWGGFLRVAVSITGHWLIGFFAHNQGHRSWHVKGASVQGYNVPFCGLITMGECWHNNHHAFPESARLGAHSGQADPGWWLLKALSVFGLVWGMKLPEDLSPRKELELFRQH